MKMKIKKSVLRQGSVIDGLLKNQTEYLKKKAEKNKAKIDADAVAKKKKTDEKKVKIDAEATVKKNNVEKNLKRDITKLNASLLKIKEPKKSDDEN